MIGALARALPLLAALGLLPGCSWITGYLGGEDNTTPPAELQPVQDAVTLVAHWQARVGDGSGGARLSLTPAVDASGVFAAAHGGQVRGFDAAGGDALWSVDTGVALTAGPGVGAGLVLVGGRNGEIIALERDTGEERWRTRVSSEVLGAPRADPLAVVVQSADGNVTALDPADGRKLWVYDRSVPVLTLRGTSSPLLNGATAITGFASGRLAALRLADGSPAWETTVAIARGRSELERMVDLDGDPVLRDGVIYAVTYQGRLAALRADSGEFLWARELSSYAGVGVDTDQVYVTDEDSHVWALDRRNGVAVWRQDDLHHRFLTAPVPFGAYVAVGDLEGYVHLLSRLDGSQRGRVRVADKAVTAAPVVVGDTLYVQADSGRLAAYRLGD